MSRIFKYNDTRIDLSHVTAVWLTQYVVQGVESAGSEPFMAALLTAFDAYHAAGDGVHQPQSEEPDPLAELDAWCKEHWSSVHRNGFETGWQATAPHGKHWCYASPDGWRREDYCWPSLPELWRWLKANPPEKEATP